MPLRRGDVHWVTFPQRDPKGAEIEKTRPCIVVSRTGVNELRRTIVVVPCTTASREAPPVVIAIPSLGNINKAVCDQIVAADKRRVGNRIGSLTQSEMIYLEESLRKLLGL